jgi:hypothetical protein
MLATTARWPRDLEAAERKTILMRLLACAEATRLGIEPSDAEIHAMACWWRRRYGLYTLEHFAAWLQYAGMDLERFMAVMHDFVVLSNVQEYYAEAIERAMGNHRAIHTIHDFVIQRDEP